RPSGTRRRLHAAPAAGAPLPLGLAPGPVGLPLAGEIEGGADAADRQHREGEERIARIGAGASAAFRRLLRSLIGCHRCSPRPSSTAVFDGGVERGIGAGVPPRRHPFAGRSAKATVRMPQTRQRTSPMFPRLGFPGPVFPRPAVRPHLLAVLPLLLLVAGLLAAVPGAAVAAES